LLSLPFRQTVALLEQEVMTPTPVSELLEETAAFYRHQFHLHPEATRYLERRGLHDPALIEEPASVTLPAETCGAIWLSARLILICC